MSRSLSLAIGLLSFPNFIHYTQQVSFMNYFAVRFPKNKEILCNTIYSKSITFLYETVSDFVD